MTQREFGIGSSVWVKLSAHPSLPHLSLNKVYSVDKIDYSTGIAHSRDCVGLECMGECSNYEEWENPVVHLEGEPKGRFCSEDSFLPAHRPKQEMGQMPVTPLS